LRGAFGWGVVTIGRGPEVQHTGLTLKARLTSEEPLELNSAL
jgi:hypothetical protein